MTVLFPIACTTKPSCPATDAFDVAKVDAANLATARPVNVEGKYFVQFDEEAELDGGRVEVRVCYPNDIGEIDTYRLNRESDPVEPEMAHWLMRGDYGRLFALAEERAFEKEAAEQENAAVLARDAYESRKYGVEVGK